MSYPATLQIDAPDRSPDGVPLVQWFLAIPHVIVTVVLGTVSYVVTIISWIAIVSPAGSRSGSQISRRCHCATTYALAPIRMVPARRVSPVRVRYPSADPGGTPVTANYSPALEGRNRLTVLLRIIWMIPAMIGWWRSSWPPHSFRPTSTLGHRDRRGCVRVPGFFAVLFTGRWPVGLRRLVTAPMRVGVRFNAYSLLLTDEYPPFSID